MKNLSGEPIQVRFVTTNEIYPETLPRLLQEGMDTDRERYVPIPPERISFVKENKTISFTLLPGEEAQLLWTPSRSSLSEYEEEFPIRTLEVADRTGSVSFTGNMAFRAFMPIKRSFFSYGPEIQEFVFEHR